MTVLKCKRCGGDLRPKPEDKIVVCEYCMAQQTIPTGDDEKKMRLFARANKLRFNNEFDTAIGVYESIIAEFPEEAEAYWGLILAKYGIEYVDDPMTGEKVPTCHRSSYVSLLDDEDYELVLENADPVSKKCYREEAKQIEELRKAIVEVSKEEKPYDIFICYKENDGKGERTIDSAIAEEIYNALNKEGYRVFFSRISLEDKIGQEYEPYIFAALHSAKIMLAVGTDYEYYDAVWVKNEWSRFLKLAASGEKKVLIPCYKDIDAYDMPREFHKLQAQDMGKVGAMQDLLRGIKKILADGNMSASTDNTAEEAYLERIQIFLNDSEWDSANTYCEKVLDLNPKNAKAYMYKICTKLKLHNIEAIVDKDECLLNKDTNYSKILAYGDEELKQKVLELSQEQIYMIAQKKLHQNNNVQNLYIARELFRQIPDYKDVNDRLYELEFAIPQKEKELEGQRKENIYVKSLQDMEQAENKSELDKALKELEKIQGYKDTDDRITDIELKIRSANMLYERFMNAYREMTKWEELEQEKLKKQREAEELEGELKKLQIKKNNVGLFDRENRRKIAEEIADISARKRIVKQEIWTLTIEAKEELKNRVVIESVFEDYYSLEFNKEIKKLLSEEQLQELYIPFGVNESRHMMQYWNMLDRKENVFLMIAKETTGDPAYIANVDGSYRRKWADSGLRTRMMRHLVHEYFNQNEQRYLKKCSAVNPRNIFEKTSIFMKSDRMTILTAEELEKYEKLIPNKENYFLIIDDQSYVTSSRGMDHGSISTSNSAILPVICIDLNQNMDNNMVGDNEENDCTEM